MLTNQATSISGEFLSKDFDRGLALVSEAVLHPTFPDDEVRKVVARRVDSLKSTKDNAGGAIDPFYETYFFGSAHPYGRVPDEAGMTASGARKSWTATSASLSERISWSLWPAISTPLRRRPA